MELQERSKKKVSSVRYVDITPSMEWKVNDSEARFFSAKMKDLFPSLKRMQFAMDFIYNNFLPYCDASNTIIIPETFERGTRYTIVSKYEAMKYFDSVYGEDKNVYYE